MRILVPVGSRHDATTEVAHAIAAAVKRTDIDVEERRPEDVGHRVASARHASSQTPTNSVREHRCTDEGALS